MAAAATATIAAEAPTLGAQVDGVDLLGLLEDRELVPFFQEAAKRPGDAVGLIRAAGLSGVIAYFIAFVIFYSIAGTAGEVAYHVTSGQWVDPRVLLLDDSDSGKAETLALLASFYLLCKPLAPLRLGGALVLTPDVNRFIQSRPAVLAAYEAFGELWEGTVGAAATAVAQSPVVAPVRRELLKDELLELAEKADGGLVALDEADRARFDEIATVPHTPTRFTPHAARRTPHTPTRFTPHAPRHAGGAARA